MCDVWFRPQQLSNNRDLDNLNCIAKMIIRSNCESYIYISIMSLCFCKTDASVLKGQNFIMLFI